MTGIYAIRNNENGKVYIGQSLDIAHRWNCHMYDLRHNRHNNLHLQRAYNQNPDAFEFLIVFECKPEELDVAEESCIKLFDTCNPEKGYNIEHKPRGTGKVSEETKRKLSAINKGRDNGHMKGRVLSDEWRQHLSEAQPHKRSIICIETAQVFDSAFDASRETGVSRNHIVSCCTGHRKTIGGYHWAYYDDYIADPEYYADILREYVPKKNAGAKVICLDTGIIYSTAREASRLLNLHPSSICNCCKGKLKSTGGYHWAYYDESEGTNSVAV